MDLTQTVSSATLAELFGISANRVSVLAADGILPREGRSNYPLAKSIQAYVAYAKENPSGRKVGNLREEKLRLAKEQADKVALQNAVTRGELVPVDDVRREWKYIVSDLRARLLAIGPRVASSTGLDRSITAKLEDEIRQCLTDIANKPEDTRFDDLI